MSRSNLRLWLAVVAALAALPAHAIQLDFYQVDWVADPAAGLGPYVSKDSDWGRVEITLTSADHGLFVPMILQDGTTGWGGFINVVTNVTGIDAWEVYNLPIFYENPLELDGRLPQGVLFDLGVLPGVDVFNLNYGFSVDPMPMLTSGPPPVGSPMNAMVNAFEILNGGDKLYLFGSLLESGGIASPQPAQAFPGAESGEVIANRASISLPETSVAGVNEDVNGWSPGAVARSLKYMSDANANVNVPDGANTVYGELKTGMGTTASGTSTAGILHGKNHYVQSHGLPITSTQTKNFKAAMDTLKNNGDVEVGMSWGQDASGKSLGAHRAFVSEVQELQDANGNTTGYVVKTVDDSKQGDGSATNATHTAKFDAAGNLIQYDGKGTATGAGLINFQTENVHASTVVLDFGGLGSVTYRVPPGPDSYIPTPFGSIPVGRPGETTTLGGVRIRFERAEGIGAIASSELAVTLPGPVETMDMNLDVNLHPLDPHAPSMMNVALHFDHVRPDGTLGSLLPVVSDGETVFLENVIAGGSFFDITYHVDTAEDESEEGDFHMFRLHSEVAEPFLETIWLEGTEVIAPSPPPGYHVDSFFDVFFQLHIEPGAYPLLGGPDWTTLFNFELSAVEVVDRIAGDANGDGFVDDRDASILGAHWLQMDDADWWDGDFNGDGSVNDKDAAILAAHWNEGIEPGPSVPEPNSVVLLLSILASLAAVGWGRRR